VIFVYNNKKGIYKAVGRNREWFFYHRRQGIYAFGFGMLSRSKIMGDEYLLHHVEFHNNDVVLDCGANIGDLKLYFLEKKIDIKYIGFEPSPKEYECLQKNIYPSIAKNTGLWDANGELDFYISSVRADSSFIEPLSYEKIIKIPTVRLDKMINTSNEFSDVEIIKLLKIEAEGGEPEVLKGCQDILDRVVYITADLDYERGLSCESTLAPVVNFLLSKNFSLVEVNNGRRVALFKNNSY
jgi:FkbM family methyltransferase